jgi:hypothetical protein
MSAEGLLTALVVLLGVGVSASVFFVHRICSKHDAFMKEIDMKINNGAAL